jgi:hypothetical protein
VVQRLYQRSCRHQATAQAEESKEEAGKARKARGEEMTQWTPDQFWEYVGGLVGDFERVHMRDMMEEHGLSVLPQSPPAAWRISKTAPDGRVSWQELTGSHTFAKQREADGYIVEPLYADTRPLHNIEGRCICQDQHRRGYCTEPGCPYSSQLQGGEK